MDTKLSNDDLKILIDAVDAWVSQNESGHMMGSLMASMISRGANGEENSQIQKDLRKREQEYEAERDRRKRKAIMLKAKLVTIQDALMDSPSDFKIENFIDP